MSQSKAYDARQQQTEESSVNEISELEAELKQIDLDLETAYKIDNSETKASIITELLTNRLGVLEDLFCIKYSKLFPASKHW